MDPPARGPGDERRERAWLAAILAAGVAMHAPSLLASFTVDDYPAIVNHPGVSGSLRDVFALDWFGRPFSETVGTYRPVVTLAFWVEQRLGGGRPWVFHAGNLAAYAALLASFHALMGRLARGAISARARLVALAVAATLTLHVDVVPSASSLCELLAALFSVLGLHVALDPRGRTWPAFAGAAILTLAMFSKESALPMAVLAPLLAWRLAERRRAWAVTAASAGALALVVAFRWQRLPMSVSTKWSVHNTLIGRPLGERLLGAAEAVSHYLEHVFAPIDLVYDYGYAAIVPGPGLTVRAALGGATAAAFVAWTVWALRRRVPDGELLLGLGASYVTASHVLLPASAFLADRWFFFPSLWLVAAAAAPLSRWASTAPRRGQLTTLGALSFAVVQSIIGATGAFVWRDDATLAAYSVRARPTAIAPRYLTAAAAAWDGRDEEAAWGLLAAAALYRRFPAPLPDDTIPAEWESRPALSRVHALRQRLGPAEFAIVRDAAMLEAHRREYGGALQTLASLR